MNGLIFTALVGISLLMLLIMYGLKFVKKYIHCPLISFWRMFFVSEVLLLCSQQKNINNNITLNVFFTDLK